MAEIAFLGLGAMGVRMASRLIDAGHRVRVWNRSKGPEAGLVERGAVAAASPREAVRGTAVALSMVRDDEASRRVWLDERTGALGGLDAKAVGIECSTVSAAWVRELSGRFRGAGRHFLDAPLSGSRPQAEAGQLVFLCGGDATDVETARPVLLSLGNAVHHCGAAGAGTIVKLFVNSMVATQVAALAELVGAARAAGLDPSKAVEAFAGTIVCSPFAKAASASMLAGKFDPLFPVELVEKDLGYAEALAKDMPLTRAARAVFRRAGERGLSGQQLTAVVKLYT